MKDFSILNKLSPRPLESKGGILDQFKIFRFFHFRPLCQLVFGSRKTNFVPRRFRDSLHRDFRSLYPLPRALPRPHGHHAGRPQTGSHHLLRPDADQCMEADRGLDTPGTGWGRGRNLRSGHVTQCKVCSGRRRSSKVFRIHCRITQVSINNKLNRC